MTCFYTGIWICRWGDRNGYFCCRNIYFYIPVWLYSMEQEWKISSEIWRNRGLISGEVSIYLKKMCIAAVGYFLGILIECYVNPLIIDIILKYIKIF